MAFPGDPLDDTIMTAMAFEWLIPGCSVHSIIISQLGRGTWVYKRLVI